MVTTVEMEIPQELVAAVAALEVKAGIVFRMDALAAVGR
jgi:hypothetical protein